jgi:hypothetical protein
MSDTPDKPTQRFGERYMEVMAALDEVNQPGRGASEETFLDACGAKRRFALEIYGGGPMTFLSAQEERADGSPGLRLYLQFDEVTQLPPYGPLRDKIRQRLATRDLAQDPDDGSLQILTGDIRAQITSSTTDPHDLPAVLIDDLELSWEDLGRLLSAYEGFGLQIRITDE